MFSDMFLEKAEQVIAMQHYCSKSADYEEFKMHSYFKILTCLKMEHVFFYSVKWERTAATLEKTTQGSATCKNVILL